MNANDPRHNYMTRINALYEAGALKSTDVREVEVAHDDWCVFFDGGYCNCEPIIVFPRSEGETKDAHRKTDFKEIVEVMLLAEDIRNAWKAQNN